MPRSLEPNSRIVFVLDCDKDKPKETQPRLFGKSLTVGASRRLASGIRAMKAAEGEAKIDAIIDIAMECITGWENMLDPTTASVIEFNRQTLQDVLSIDELSEIIELTASNGRLGVDDRKKSESPPLSGAESFV